MSPLQFQIIPLLFPGPQTGPDLRRQLEAAGTRMSLPSFCRLMQRMEFADYVEVETVSAHSGDRIIHVRRYRLTDVGLAVWSRARDAHVNAPTPPPDLAPVVTGNVDLADLSPKRRRRAADRRAEDELKRAFERYATFFFKHHPDNPDQDPVDDECE